MEETKMLIKANENSKFLDERFSQLQTKYANKIIAIKEKKVVAVADDIKTLLKEIPKEELNSILITSVLPKEIAYIL